MVLILFLVRLQPLLEAVVVQNLETVKPVLLVVLAAAAVLTQLLALVALELQGRVTLAAMAQQVRVLHSLAVAAAGLVR
jgi:hypothetical protein